METLLLSVALSGSLLATILSAVLWNRLRDDRERSAARVAELKMLAFEGSAFEGSAFEGSEEFSTEGVGGQLWKTPPTPIPPTPSMFAATMETPAPIRRWYVLAVIFALLAVFGGTLYALR